MSRQIAKVGDVFSIPLDDDSTVLSQIVEIVPDVLNSITIAVFDNRTVDRTSPPKILATEDESLIACQFVTRELFTIGVWQRIGHAPVHIARHQLPYRETEHSGWIGAKMIGSGIIRSFVSAYYGLRAWDEMKDPEYYTKLLLPGVPIPSTAFTEHEA